MTDRIKNYDENVEDTEELREASIHKTVNLLEVIQERKIINGSMEAESAPLISNPLPSNQNETPNKMQNNPFSFPNPFAEEKTHHQKQNFKETQRLENKHPPPPVGEFKLHSRDDIAKSNPYPPTPTPNPPPPPPLSTSNCTPEIPSIFPNKLDKNILDPKIQEPLSNYKSPFPISQKNPHECEISSLGIEPRIYDYPISNETSENEINDTERNVPSESSSIFNEANIPTPSVFIPKSQFFKEESDQISQAPQYKPQSLLHQNENSRNSSEDENSSNQSRDSKTTDSFEVDWQNKITEIIPPPSWKNLQKKNPFEIDGKDIIPSKLATPPQIFNVKLHRETPHKNVANIDLDKSYDSDEYDSDNAEVYYHDDPKDEINEEKLSLIIIPDILENLSWLLNHRKMFLSGSHTEIYKSLYALTENAPEPMKLAFSSLLSSFHCDRCQVKFYQGVTSCNHKLCKECSIDVLRKSTKNLILLTTYEEERYKSICPKCKKKLLEKDLEAILGDEYEIYDFDRNKRQIDQDKIQREAYMDFTEDTIYECCSCRKQLRDELCFENDICKHQCKECLANSMRRGKTGCPLCRETYSMEISHEKDICKGCNQLLYFIGNSLRTVCKGHLMCNRCINESYLAKKCKVCGIAADRNLLMEFDKILFARCAGPCQEKKNLDYFIMKECCNQDICIECQAHDKEACININCRKRLGNWAKQQLQYIASSQNI